MKCEKTGRGVSLESDKPTESNEMRQEEREVRSL